MNVDSRPRWERRYDKRAGRRYMHMTPWRRCRIGFCVRCWTRQLTGANRRAKAAELKRYREVFDMSAMRWPATPHPRTSPPASGPSRS